MLNLLTGEGSGQTELVGNEAADEQPGKDLVENQYFQGNMALQRYLGVFPLNQLTVSLT